jgi:hypothetical protein
MSDKLTTQARRALEYVRNTGGNATYDTFMDDHEPVGQALWKALRFPVALIQHDPAPGRDRYLILTDAGVAALSSNSASSA